MTTALLLDIEGTTTSIQFVTDVLFPYAARAIPGFIAEHGQRPDVAEACRLVVADADDAERRAGGAATVLAVVRRQMAADAKATGLKMLQGLVWEHGYRSGAITGHVFADVAPALRRWKAEGRPAAIYSSGSVLAQRLLFGHSDAGDLSPLLCGHYDTAMGPKREAPSYARIAQAWGREPSGIVFASDQPAECAAAAAAGMQAVLLMRPGNAPLPPGQAFAVHGDLSRL